MEPTAVGMPPCLPQELFTQLSGLCPSAKLKLKDFGERYCQVGQALHACRRYAVRKE
jgi:hypothetical protein